MSNLTTEESRKRISEINKEINNTKKKAQHFKTLRTERQKLQNLLETQERTQQILEAKKRQTEIMRQVNEELRKINNAQQTVTEALKKLEPLKWKLWNLETPFQELPHMSFTIPTLVQKFALPDALPTEWAEL